MKDNDKEIWIGENRFYLDENNIIHETVVGEIDDETAIVAKKVVADLIEMADGEVKIMIDITQAGTPSRNARLIGQESLNDERIGKIAIFGMNPVAKVIASFFMNFTHKNNIKFFKIKKEAIEWLNK
ncbi:MAG: STAS/SEC14 domain-containing protein [Thermoplasmata archaeon]|nr:STAS/SEC14 domain-containing protein [Thermoplasmata archaeon]